ncbi:hypothetical protein N0V82_003970 [Gnomoniopsis sp. IMI 355080]|nr:hypothetical protein N0V82_003970 [Gnomoniopsis sp. IMI 355080]
MHPTHSANDHLASLQPWLIAVVASLAALSAVFVGLRLTSRRLMQQKLWWDDWFIMISMACNLVSVGIIFAMYSQGLGLPSSAVPPTQIVNMTKISLAAKIVFAWNLCLTKISILLMYYRIFDLSRSGKVYLVAIGSFVVLWSVISTFLFVLTCIPLQKLWQPKLTGSCLSLVVRWYANAVSTVLADLMIIFLPITQVFRMTLSRMEKIAVTLVFAQGFFVIFASAYRYVLLFSSYSAANTTYTTTATIAWTEIEIAAGIVAACLPVLSPLLPRTTKQTIFFSGSSWSGTWHRPSKQLSGDSTRPSFAICKNQCASAKDAWDWSQCVESQTRPIELAKNEHQATVSRGSDSDLIDVPLYGISVTKDFRRYSVIDPSNR